MKYLFFLAALGCSTSSPLPGDYSYPSLVVANLDAGVTPLPHYNVYVDNAFTIDQKIDIATALRTWNKKTSNIFQFNLMFVKTQDIATSIEPGIIKIFARNPNNNLLGWTTWNSQGSYTYLLPSLIDDMTFTMVTIHEVGHAVGLFHDMKHELSIMHKDTSDAQTIECPDLIQFCSMWSCTAICDVIQDPTVNIE